MEMVDISFNPFLGQWSIQRDDERGEGEEEGREEEKEGREAGEEGGVRDVSDKMESVAI